MSHGMEELNKDMQRAVPRFEPKENPTYEKDEHFYRSNRRGFETACEVIYLHASKHLGGTHPVMQFIRTLQESK